MLSIAGLKAALDPFAGSPRAVAEEFAAWYRQAKVAQIRYVAFLTMALYWVYAALEQQVSADQHGVRLLMHGLVVPGMLLGVGLMSFSARHYRAMVRLLCVAPVVAIAASLYLNGSSAEFAHYAPELYLAIMWTFAISGLSLQKATLSASVMVLLTLVATLLGPPRQGVQHLHLLWVAAAFSFGALSAFLLEKAHKTMFLHQSRLTFSASVDGLTGLWNRAWIDQFLVDEIARTQRYGSPFAVILLDVDHFKQVNDTHGHLAGDAVLRQFGALLRDHVRSVDKVGRLGGEEFLIVLPGIGAEQAQAAARSLQQRINSFEFETVRHKTASFGITEFKGDASSRALLERADRALYQAKKNGRNRIEVA